MKSLLAAFMFLLPIYAFSGAKAAGAYAGSAGIADSSLYKVPELIGSVNGYITEADFSVKGMQGVVSYRSDMRPDNYYTVYQVSGISVKPGEILETKIKSSGTEGQRVFLYADWNGDGHFESEYSAVKGKKAANFCKPVEVPAGAVPGKARLRVRLSDDKLNGSDYRVISGSVYDFIIDINE